MSKKAKREDWQYPPNYNHLLGYVETGNVPRERGKKKDKGSDPVYFDRDIKNGRDLNK